MPKLEVNSLNTKSAGAFVLSGQFLERKYHYTTYESPNPSLIETRIKLLVT